MRIEILPSRKGGHDVLFTEASLKEVSMIKVFSLAMLREMGYQLNPSEIEERGEFLFFNISSSNGNPVRVTDIYRVIAGIKEG